jgi:hypothetical protein
VLPIDKVRDARPVYCSSGEEMCFLFFSEKLSAWCIAKVR